MKKSLFLLFSLFAVQACFGQLQWQNMDSLYGPLPSSVHVYYTAQAVDTAPFRAFYLIADLKDKHLDFTTDTTLNRRLTPSQFYERNNKPLAVVNGTFFSFETNRSLNVVMKDGKVLAYDDHIKALKGRDSLLFTKHTTSAFGISKAREADVAWVYNVPTMRWPIAFERNPEKRTDSLNGISKYDFAPELHHFPKTERKRGIRDAWKMKTAIGGGPVLLYEGKIRITNEEELKFTGKAINDKHPRTAMGYTAGNKLIILMVEGRNNAAHGATLQQEARILKDLGCIEALNLDGGGSSCLLVNGKETIKVSDATGQRPVPAVFLIMSNE